MMSGSRTLKRSSGNNASLSSVLDEDNEDEADGNGHGILSHHSSTNVIPVAGPSGLNNNRNTLNGNLEAYFQLYIKNKITSHNVWQVNIFEYITSLLESNTNLRSLLQKACTSLDIGAKVYSVRVDDVHYQTLQLANSLALLYKNKLQKRDNDEKNEIDEQNDQENKSITEPPRKKRRRNLLSSSEERRTVTTTEDSLCGSIVKLPRKTMCIQNTTNSYLNLTLPVAPYNCELLVNNSLNNFKWGELNSNSSVKYIQVPVPEELQLISSTICPTFQEFDIDQWDPDENADLFNKSNLSEVEFMTLLKSPRMQNTQSKIFSPNDCDIDCGKSTISGITALTNDDDARTVHYDDDLLNNDKSQEDIEVMETIGHGKKDNFDFITNMRPDTAGENLEYSYRKIPKEALFDSMWAGPSHWKLKHLQRIFTPESEVVKLDKSKRRSGIILPLYLEDEIEEDILKMIKPSKKPMYRTFTLQNDSDNTVLPERININIADTLFSTFYRRQSKNQCVSDCEIMNVDNDNDEDRNDEIRSGWGDATPHHVTDDEDSGVQVSTIGTPGTDIQNNWILTSPGNVIKKGWVTYSNQAKRIDMKQLKTTMWNEIAQKCDTKVPDTTLSNIYRQLPEKLTAMQADSLSVPLAFVALLHLANEHSLILQGNETLSDIIVKKEKTD